jgi:hypothetical protein
MYHLEFNTPHNRLGETPSAQKTSVALKEFPRFIPILIIEPQAPFELLLLKALRLIYLAKAQIAFSASTQLMKPWNVKDFSRRLG